MCQEQGIKGNSPRSPLAEAEVNPIQELARILHELFDSPTQIPWQPSIFGIDGVPLYITMQDIVELISGSQMLNINIIQLWMM